MSYDMWLVEPWETQCRLQAEAEAREERAEQERMCRWCEDVPAVAGERECAECIAYGEAEEVRAAGDSRRSDER